LGLDEGFAFEIPGKETVDVTKCLIPVNFNFSLRFFFLFLKTVIAAATIYKSRGKKHR
jgi:hypothetical protein